MTREKLSAMLWDLRRAEAKQDFATADKIEAEIIDALATPAEVVPVKPGEIMMTVKVEIHKCHLRSECSHQCDGLGFNIGDEIWGCLYDAIDHGATFQLLPNTEPETEKG